MRGDNQVMCACTCRVVSEKKGCETSTGCGSEGPGNKVDWAFREGRLRNPEDMAVAMAMERAMGNPELQAEGATGQRS
jgi:hypothetical protein